MRGGRRDGTRAEMPVRLTFGRRDGRGCVLEVGDVVPLEAAQETFGVAAGGRRLPRVAALADARHERRAVGQSDAVEVRRADEEGVPEEREQQQRGRQRRGHAAPVSAGKTKSQRSPVPEKLLLQLFERKKTGGTIALIRPPLKPARRTRSAASAGHECGNRARPADVTIGKKNGRESADDLRLDVDTPLRAPIKCRPSLGRFSTLRN